MNLKYNTFSVQRRANSVDTEKIKGLNLIDVNEAVGIVALRITLEESVF